MPLPSKGSMQPEPDTATGPTLSRQPTPEGEVNVPGVHHLDSSCQPDAACQYQNANDKCRHRMRSPTSMQLQSARIPPART